MKGNQLKTQNAALNVDILVKQTIILTHCKTVPMIPVRNDILNVLSISLVVSAIYEYKPRFMHIYPPKHPSIPANNILSRAIHAFQ